MSNSLAIAATTNALRNLLLSGIPALDSELVDVEVTTRTPDVARKSVNGASLNLFLYQTVVNGAWSNTGLPRQTRPGEDGRPPLALNLRYLVTAYGRTDTDSDALSHRVLGGAMSVLHDHPLLGRDEIRGALADNDLADQIERVRITPVPMSIEEMSKLWTIFQTHYRVSATYEAAVILIDSRQAARAPLPVLRRGQGDRGVDALASAAPVVREIRPPRPQPAARLDEEIAIAGDHLRLADTSVRFTGLMPPNPGRPAPPVEEIPPQPGAAPGEIAVRLRTLPQDPDAFGRWAPGFYTVCLLTRRADAPLVASNETAFALAPIVAVTPNSTAASVSPGDTVTLTCAPRVREGQRVLILFGNRQIAPKTLVNPDPASPTFRETPTTISFEVPAADPGLYLVRLRVDGVDSIPFMLDGTPPVPVFDPGQQVRVS
ncbi:MAG TPA: DUF4255 domain-containing protein [Paucimonas sp.]|nr:DUF4255 domain-containing protein [Paucimonas sp.]